MYNFWIAIMPHFKLTRVVCVHMVLEISKLKLGRNGSKPQKMFQYKVQTQLPQNAILYHWKSTFPTTVLHTMSLKGTVEKNASVYTGFLNFFGGVA